MVHSCVSNELALWRRKHIGVSTCRNVRSHSDRDAVGVLRLPEHDSWDSLVHGDEPLEDSRELPVCEECALNYDRSYAFVRYGSG